LKKIGFLKPQELLSEMNKLLETIKIVNGAAPFLAFHNARLNKSREILFNAKDEIDLKNFIQAPQSGIYKCRIIYAKTIETIEYSPLQNRNFKTFKVIENDNITYPFKYLNRENLNHLMQFKGQADDILIVKKGLVTETSIANVAFLHQDKWLTPSMPLLKGTTRERLLREKKVVEATIRLEDLKNISKMAIMNALLGFYLIEDFKLLTESGELL
jgi:4-amino-4-deoxychorismate lyase